MEQQAGGLYHNILAVHPADHQLQGKTYQMRQQPVSPTRAYLHLDSDDIGLEQR